MHSSASRKIVQLLLFSFLLACAGTVAAQEFRRIENRWKPGQFLNIEHGRIESGPIERGWWSAQWIIEPVRDTPYVRIRNRWKPEEFLHVQNGRLESGPIERGWFSAMWTIEGAEAGAFRIHNRWKNERFLNIEHGRLEAGPIENGWWSAMWYLR